MFTTTPTIAKQNLFVNNVNLDLVLQIKVWPSVRLPVHLSVMRTCVCLPAGQFDKRVT